MSILLTVAIYQKVYLPKFAPQGVPKKLPPTLPGGNKFRFSIIARVKNWYYLEIGITTFWFEIVEYNRCDFRFSLGYNNLKTAPLPR